MKKKLALDFEKKLDINLPLVTKEQMDRLYQLMKEALQEECRLGVCDCITVDSHIK